MLSRNPTIVRKVKKINLLNNDTDDEEEDKGIAPPS